MTWLRRFPRRLVNLSIVGLIVLSISAVAAACPTCGEALGNDPHHQQRVAGFAYSIVFMMSVPYLLIGSFGSYAYFITRRARNAEKSQPPGENEESSPAK